MASSANVAKLEVNEDDGSIRRLTHNQRAMMRLKKDYLTLSAIGVLLLFVILALGAPLISGILGTSPEAENLQKVLQPPDSDNWLGTDDKGRDHLTRLLYGARISLSVAFFAAVLALSIGISLGMATGYYGGVVDDFLNWVVTTLDSIPGLYLLLIISALFNPNPIIFILVLGLLGWTGILRLVRGETLALREREFIVAARAMGASDWRIMAQHIFPNLISIVVITLTINIGGLILTESALSFLGFGIPSYIPTWGNMLSEALQFINRDASHLVFAPGVLITVTVLCLYIIGDGLRDALDPTMVDA
jgi:peptide/nickel transport system permease protein